MKEITDRIKRAFLNRRKFAYQMLFRKDTAYFDEVMADLLKFCRWHESAFHPDPRVHAMLEGRREVMRRILQHLNLSLDDLWKLHEKRKDLSHE